LSNFGLTRSWAGGPGVARDIRPDLRESKRALRSLGCIVKQPDVRRACNVPPAILQAANAGAGEPARFMTGRRLVGIIGLLVVIILVILLLRLL
jgi:hypothetical protein